MGARNFAGNKAHLETKPCQHCQRPMTWRKAWAKNWESVRYCSERCSRDAARQRRSASDTGVNR